MTDQKFYICRHCGNIIAYVRDTGVSVMCCGAKMDLIVPNTTEASGEKHLPVVKTQGNTVTVCVGSVPHPMTQEHHIMWVSLHTNEGNQRREPAVGSAPEAVFVLKDGERPQTAFAFCNLHGLWMTNI